MKVSVIIPAYNCEKTLNAALDSLPEQSGCELEILVVDDGSTDSTPVLLRKRAGADPRIRVLSTKNGGPAIARNTGLAAASGEYIAFMDSDDLAALGLYERLAGLAGERGLDCVVCGYRAEEFADGAAHGTDFCFPSFSGDAAEFQSRLTPLLRSHLMYVVWNKCWRAEFLRENGLRFEDFHNGEDRLFNIRALPLYRSFGCIGEPLYRYRIGGGGLANRYVENRFDSALCCHRELWAGYERMGLLDGPNGPENQGMLSFQFVTAAMACITQLFSPDCLLSSAEKREAVRDILNHPELRAALAAPDSAIRYSRAIDGLLRGGNVTLALAAAGSIRWMQTRLHPLYLKWKHSAPH